MPRPAAFAGSPTAILPGSKLEHAESCAAAVTSLLAPVNTPRKPSHEIPPQIGGDFGQGCA